MYIHKDPDKDMIVIGDHFQNLLWGRRIKATPIRLKVLKIISNTKNPNPSNLSGPLTIEKISEQTHASIATIYRTVELFVKEGIISKIKLGQNHYSYESALGPRHSHHAVCMGCGMTEELSICNKRDLEISAQANLKRFAHIMNHSLEFFGTCRECQEKSITR